MAEQEMRMELHVEWVNGRVNVSGPPNPILAMIILSDTMKVLASEYTKIASSNKSPIIQPGVVPVHRKVLEEADKS